MPISIGLSSSSKNNTDLEKSISKNKLNITDNVISLSVVNSTIENLTDNITDINTTTDGLTTNITQNANNITTINTTTDNLTTNITQNTNDIATINTTTDGLTTNITTINNDITTINTNITQNTNNITQNTTNIATALDNLSKWEQIEDDIYFTGGSINIQGPLIQTVENVADVTNNINIISGNPVEIIQIGDYKVMIFKHDQSDNPTTDFSIELNQSFECEILLMGGGGSGGSRIGNSSLAGAGGGAGGMIFLNNYELTDKYYTIKVGKGGVGRAVNLRNNESGYDTTFNNYTAYGGGRGGIRHCVDTAEALANATGGVGGCGGGSSYNTGSIVTGPILEGGLSRQDDTKNYSYGFQGGGFYNPNTSLAYIGGGGGVGGQGGGYSSINADRIGDGGIGLSGANDLQFIDIFGENVGHKVDNQIYFGGGGGSGNGTSGAYANTGGAGGIGGGALGENNGNNNIITSAQNGTAHTGGGGGGTRNKQSGSGGSGIVIIRFSSPIISPTYNILSTPEIIMYNALLDTEIYKYTHDQSDNLHTNYEIIISENILCDILIVGGGGGGGCFGGGGGGGDVVYYENINLLAGTYDIKIGRGGKGGEYVSGNAGEAGGGIGTYSSILGNIPAGSDTNIKSSGGGGGSGWALDAINAPAQSYIDPFSLETMTSYGGGGGSSKSTINTGSGFGNSGNGGIGNNDGSAGGAGGAGGGSVGNGSDSYNSTLLPHGGYGKIISITGYKADYGGGGGGGGYSFNGLGGSFGYSYSSGAGGGSFASISTAIPNFGGGGGGSGLTENANVGRGDGGSGVVIIRYKKTNNGNICISPLKIGSSIEPKYQLDVYCGETNNFGSIRLDNVLIGRAGYDKDYMMIMHENLENIGYIYGGINNSLTPNYALAQDKEGQTSINSLDTKHIKFCIGNVERMTLYTTVLNIGTDVYYYGTQTGPSDKLIKENIRPLKTKSLDIINQLNFVNYEYIDKKRHGYHTTLGLIAQEASNIYPQSVKLRSDYIPSHMDYINIETSNIYTSTAIDFIGGDKLKFVDKNNTPFYHICKNIIDSNHFTTETEINENLFLIGKEVDNFHALNKSVLYMIGLSSIQDLSKQNETQQIVIDSLTNQYENQKIVIDGLTNQNGTQQIVIDRLTNQNGTQQIVIDRLTNQYENQKIIIDNLIQRIEQLESN